MIPVGFQITVAGPGLFQLVSFMNDETINRRNIWLIEDGSVNDYDLLLECDIAWAEYNRYQDEQGE